MTIQDIKNTIYARWYFAKELTMFTSIYYETSHFGGEEEGGWFYNNYQFVESYFTPLGFGMYRAEKKLIEKYRGRDYIVFNEKFKGMHEDGSIHHYC